MLKKVNWSSITADLQKKLKYDLKNIANVFIGKQIWSAI